MRPLYLAVGLVGRLGFSAVRWFVDLRIGKIPSGRIGPFATVTELFLRRKASGKEWNRGRYVFVTREPSNRQLLAMIKRKLPVVESPFLVQVYEAMRHDPLLSPFRSWNGWVDHFRPFDSWLHEFHGSVPQLSFTAEEERRGRETLANMGAAPDVPFVCVHARDKAYLDKIHPYKSRAEWSYHDYRDCDLSHFFPAAKFLTGKGHQAIRVGYVVEGSLPPGQEHVFDYANRGRTDFGDIYLAAKCRFFLGSESGIICISYIFNVPTVKTNVVPLRFVPVGSKDLFVPKKLWSIMEKRFLTFREMVRLGADNWQYTQDYVKAGVEVVQNTPEEILAVVQEMIDRLDGAWRTTEQEEDLRRSFRAIFPAGHPCRDHPARIGTTFLRENAELLR